jgi:nucleotide-binding universal stress UspA family protein
MSEILFRKILCGYDGSDHASDAFILALAIAKQNGSELHIVSVGEIDHIP